MNLSDIREEVNHSFEKTVERRRFLHRNPELSFHEFRTTEYICSELVSSGITEIERPTATGAVALIRGAFPGKTVAIRADIDALPIMEENDLPFRSVTDNCMHACGHDGHASMLLTAAEIFSRHRDEMHGNVKCIFQHAEEVPPGGAAEMYEAGVMDGVDELYGLHLSSNFPTGKYGVRSGVLTSATDRFDIEIRGKGGHSSMPEMTIDPVVLGAETILSLQTILSRRLKALDPAVLSVCQVQAGSIYNIIPETMTLSGSVRTFSEETREKMPCMIREITEGIVSTNGGKCTVSYEKGYGSVINDPALTESVTEVLTGLYGPECILKIDPIMPGEDFSALQKNCPACFVEIGTADREKDTCHPHHNPKYMMDEEGLRYGTAYLAGVILSRLDAVDREEAR